MPLGVDGRLLFGHFAVAHPLLGQAVVVGDLNHLPVGEDVSPRVAHVGQGQHVTTTRAAHQREGGQSGPHAAEVGVDLAFVPDGGVGLCEGVTKTGYRRRALEGPF